MPALRAFVFILVAACGSCRPPGTECRHSAKDRAVAQLQSAHRTLVASR